MDYLRSRWSGSPKPWFEKAKSVSAQRLSPLDMIFRNVESPSIYRPRICRRKAAASIYRLQSAYWQLTARSIRAHSTIESFTANLSLGGALRETPKLLPALIAGAKLGSEIILPSANALEASLLKGAKVCLMNHLSEVVAALAGKAAPPARPRTAPAPAQAQVRAGTNSGAISQALEAAQHRDPNKLEAGHKSEPDFSEVRGQYAAKRALEIAAAAEHGLLKPLTIRPRI